LGSTGAIVRSIAVGDAVDCNKSDFNDLDDIPQNGGQSFSILNSNALTTTLMRIEMKMDQTEY